MNYLLAYILTVKFTIRDMQNLKVTNTQKNKDKKKNIALNVNLNIF